MSATPVAENAQTVAQPTAPSAKRSIFGRLTNLSLSVTSAEPAPIIRPSTTKAGVQVMEVRAQSRFTDAPMPNDMEAPAGAPQSTDPSLQPDFFRRSAHQTGDALANGAADNQQRRGHGSMAAGVALAVPMD